MSKRVDVRKNTDTWRETESGLEEESLGKAELLSAYRVKKTAKVFVEIKFAGLLGRGSATNYVGKLDPKSAWREACEDALLKIMEKIYRRWMKVNFASTVEGVLDAIGRLGTPDDDVPKRREQFVELMRQACDFSREEDRLNKRGFDPDADLIADRVSDKAEGVLKTNWIGGRTMWDWAEEVGLL